MFMIAASSLVASKLDDNQIKPCLLRVKLQAVDMDKFKDFCQSAKVNH